jgi:uncharacterized protein YndB with AHSA1/START domain
MSDDSRSIELEIEVPGTPEEVWRAIATGPGISSWYVPHVVEEREGGSATASFGPGPEMQVEGRVAVWDPPRRICFDGGEGVDGLAFEWLIEARDGGSCVVRLVNTGFDTGGEWDDYFDGMTEGWRLFLSNLRLHLRHFKGQTARASLPLASWAGPADQAWSRLVGELNLEPGVSADDRVELRAAADGPVIAGRVVETEPTRITLLLDQPSPGTGFIAAEKRGDHVEVSVWTYLYGPDRDRLAHELFQTWTDWLGQRAIAPAP